VNGRVGSWSRREKGAGVGGGSFFLICYDILMCESDSFVVG